MKSIAVFGAGIAGLTVAHELARRGHQVRVFESTNESGGFFRSARVESSPHIPTEYSWHGFGPWYHNVFDILKQIPFDEISSLYDKGLSRPIDFGLAPDKGEAQFTDGRFFVPVSRMFRMRGLDSIRWGWLMFKTWTAHRRTLEYYSRINASDAWRPLLSSQGWKTWRACFGPWIGSDWTNVSLHQTGEFFRKQFMTQPTHHYAADSEGPAWSQGAGDGWLLLRGPCSDVWFSRWVKDLKTRGVEFFWEKALHRIDFDGIRAMSAELANGETVHADIFVVATNPFAAAEILARTPELEELDQLRNFKPLIQRGPHIQVSFRIAFAEEIAWPRPRMAIILADSEFNITLFAQEQAWSEKVNLGEGVKSLWTGTACASTVPGRKFGLPLENCTIEQFLDEIQVQLLACESLDEIIRSANDGRSFSEFPIVKLEIWHEWQFSPNGIRSFQPKWVNTTNTQPYQPTQATPVSNLMLAGAHTRTEADVWSIEAAAESGRRAAKLIDSDVAVLPQYRPWWVRILGKLDDACFGLGLPHFIDIVLIILLSSILIGIAFSIWNVVRN